MKDTRYCKKLALNKETVAHLHIEQMHRVNGGAERLNDRLAISSICKPPTSRETQNGTCAVLNPEIPKDN